MVELNPDVVTFTDCFGNLPLVDAADENFGFLLFMTYMINRKDDDTTSSPWYQECRQVSECEILSGKLHHVPLLENYQSFASL
jgi:hypothetical protein